MINTNTSIQTVMSLFVISFCFACSIIAGEAPPDLTKGELTDVDRTKTYNLGSTGLRGWIYTKPVTHFDGLQGRTTALSRQILVTHVGEKSPADGVLNVDDVILGIGNKPFTDDARKSLAVAIQAAEEPANRGALTILRWRTGKTETVTLKLQVMGTYGATAPYNCPKSKKILEAASEALEKEAFTEDWRGAISGLALLATGKPQYRQRLEDFARKIAPKTLNLAGQGGMVTWQWGYKLVFLSEYYLATGDKEVLPGLTEYATALAKGQSLYGTFGHGIAELTPDGKLHGSIPPYGPVNMAGLPANLGILLSKKCGINDPEIDAAIERAMGFFSYYVDKGAIPYGEHEPWPYHENNGKNSLCAVLFSLQPGQTNAAKFYAKMATAGYRNRECGHTGQGFSYLWSALGANAGGPDAAAAFFKESAWHFDLVRRSDGSFTYDGAEQYGPGKTDDDTYYGKSGYNGLSPNATYVLTYAMPLKQLFITGRKANTANWLSKREVADAIASGRFDTDKAAKNPQELIAAFSDWSPIVRSWAAEELAKRPEAKALVPKLIDMAHGDDPHVIQSASEVLGLLKTTDALPVLSKLVAHEDRWVRFKAGNAIKNFGGAAAPVLPELVQALVQTADPTSPINWADPIQLAHGVLAGAVFRKPLVDGLKDIDQKVVFSAIRAVANSPGGHTRAALKDYFQNRLTAEDVQALGPLLFTAIKIRCPADTMFGNEIRMGAYKALTKYKFKEGIEAAVIFAKEQGSHGSEHRTDEIMKLLVPYGSAARSAIPGLKEVIDMFNDQVKRRVYPKGDKFNGRRVKAIEDAIATIEASKEAPKMRSFDRTIQ